MENQIDDQSLYKDALLRKRGEILAAGNAAKPIQQAGLDNNSRQGDLADQAAGNNEVHIQLKLKQVDAKILQAIEEALGRLDKGTYGICRDCGEPIAPGQAQGDSLDPGLHHLQGKAKRVKATELLDLLTEFYRDKMAMRQRHIAAARLVSDYDFNNTYQYVIAREDLQLNWLRDAVTDMGALPADVPEPTIADNGKGAQLQAVDAPGGLQRRAGVPRQVEAAGRRPQPRPPPDHAERHPRRDHRAPPLLRSGTRGAQRPARPARRWRGHRRGSHAHALGRIAAL